MSLLATATPFDTNEVIKTNKSKNKTIKRAPKKDISELIKLTGIDDDDSDSENEDFQPLAPPSMTKMPNQIPADACSTDIKLPSNNSKELNAPVNSHPSSYENFSIIKNEEPSTYDIAHNDPNFMENLNSNITSIAHTPSNLTEIDKKLSYIAHLLEEQRNTRTDTVMEECILTAFLGVFTIYVIDSFTKFGHSYVR